MKDSRLQLGRDHSAGKRVLEKHVPAEQMCVLWKKKLQLTQASQGTVPSRREGARGTAAGARAQRGRAGRRLAAAGITQSSLSTAPG